MDDLLKYQIHQNCRLALPEGLKDLMSDISREVLVIITGRHEGLRKEDYLLRIALTRLAKKKECHVFRVHVLRAQPQNLHQFIANYLGALLEARETLTIACQVCSDICKCTCEPIEPELYHELREIGLDEEDLETAIEVIEKHLKGNEPMKEQPLLSKLLRKTSMNEMQLPAIQQAIQRAFKRRLLGQGDVMDFKNESNKETFEAVHHTLQSHLKQNKPKVQINTEEVFVAPVYNSCVTTVSSSSLAGSFVPLPRFRPYNAHDNETLSESSEKEQYLPIDNKKDETTTNIEPKKIEISKRSTVEENDEKYKASAHFDDNYYENEDNHEKSISVDDYNDYAEATAGTGLKLNKVKISDEIAVEEIDEPDGHSVSSLDDNSDKMKLLGYSDDEVQEFIENEESEIESSVSSVAESIQNDTDE